MKLLILAFMTALSAFAANAENYIEKVVDTTSPPTYVMKECYWGPAGESCGSDLECQSACCSSSTYKCSAVGSSAGCLPVPASEATVVCPVQPGIMVLAIIYIVIAPLVICICCPVLMVCGTISDCTGCFCGLCKSIPVLNLVCCPCDCPAFVSAVCVGLSVWAIMFAIVTFAAQAYYNSF